LVFAVFGRVVEQIADDLRQPCRIGPDRHRFVRQFYGQLVPAGFQQRPNRFDGATGGVAQVDVFAAQVGFAARDARNVEQVVDEAGQQPHLTVHHLARVLESRRVVRRELHHFQAVANRRQRVAQLVRQHRQEFILSAIGLAQLRGLPIHFGDVVAHQVLSRTIAQRGSHGVEKLQDVQRAAQQGNVADFDQRSQRPAQRSFGRRQHENRQTRPRRLMSQNVDHTRDTIAAYRLVRNNRGSCPRFDLATKLDQRRAIEMFQAGSC
jgi:hypothetical protein